MEHDALSRAIVIGVKNPRYVEVPGAFLQLREGCAKPSHEEIKSWVRKVLGRHKAPVHIFWLGEDYTDEVPVTGSGKIKKFEMRKIAEELMAAR